MRERHFRLYVAVVLAAVVLMTYQSRSGIMRPLAAVTTPVKYAALAVTRAAAHAREAVLLYRVTDLELGRMRREIDRRRLLSLRMRDLELENGRLRNLLGVSAFDPSVLAVARVVGRGSDRWSSSFLIDKGADHGIAKDLPVITPEGLLGKVQQVEGRFATVLLLDDERFGAAVRLQESRAEAIVSGAGQGRCVLKYLSSEQPVAAGDVVVTSALGGVFPPGLPVGVVSSVEGRPDEFFQHVEVAPFVNTTAVEEVLVLRP